MPTTLRKLQLICHLVIVSLIIAGAQQCYAQQTGQTREHVAHDAQSSENLDSPARTMADYLFKHPEAGVVADVTFPQGRIRYGEQGATSANVVAGVNPGVRWPELGPAFPVRGSEHLRERLRRMNEITHHEDARIGPYPLTAAFAA